MWSVVNKIKGREWWRPLAPSLLEEDAGKYFMDPVPHQFIILMFKYRGEMCEVVPAVCHVDQTARLQDAIKSFALGGFKAIYLQGWLIQK